MDNITKQTLQDLAGLSELRRSVDAEWRREVLAAVEAGIPVTQVADAAKVSRQAVYDILRVAGATVPSSDQRPMGCH